MAIIRYAQHAGSSQDVTLTEGSNLMELARANAVPGIDGDCGGSCACGTCHVIVDAAWAAKLAAPNSEEERLLSMVVDRQPHSRLACQIIATEALDGLRLQVPEHQF
ncbi:MAG TPA: 2Fe-2S iron-sulfur cluster-binding protein [Nevskia sp.]|nr:2Fe-2S iron-sulfur cluster-binding protein [Nevskia sp.]